MIKEKAYYFIDLSPFLLCTKLTKFPKMVIIEGR